MKRILVTGGAGFIGSNFVRYYRRVHPEVAVVVLDLLTYAGLRDNVPVEEGVEFIHGDVRDAQVVDQALEAVDAVVHFAAESHVDRSIIDAHAFISTNVLGTQVLLDGARARAVHRFVHVSTDEVYGSVERGASREEDPLRPSSPYAASKASSDLIALAHHQTFGTPVLITRSSNNFGPRQYPEKLIPLFITNAIQSIPLPLYGDGMNVRDWLYVEDNCEGIDTVLRCGEVGGIYNLGTGRGFTNREITDTILGLLGRPASLVQMVKDRPGHDRRYSIDVSRATALGWRPRHPFGEALELTLSWYRDNEPWWRAIKEQQREYAVFYRRQYGEAQARD